MKEQFTLGPWSIAASVMGETAITHTGNNSDEGTHICTLPLLSKYSAVGEEYKANAALIAAAPELYEALKSLMDFIQDYAMYDIHGKDITSDAPLLEAEAALSKANPQK